MYALIFWGALLRLVTGFFSVPMGPWIGMSMMAYGCWGLSRHVPSFRLAAMALILNAIVSLAHRLMENTMFSTASYWLYVPASVWLGALLECVMGWYLLSSIATHCEKQYHLDVAFRTRIARYIYVASILVLPVSLETRAFSGSGSEITFLMVSSWAMALVGLVALVWTIQTAKIRLS